MAGALRFRLFGSLGDGFRPLWRAPGPLILLVVPLMLVAGGAAMVETLYASGPGLWPWLGRVAIRLFFVGLDVTLGSAIVLVALAALERQPVDWRAIAELARRALPVTLIMSLLGSAVWLYVSLVIFEPIGEPRQQTYPVYAVAQLVHLAWSTLIAVTWGQAQFAALTGSPFGSAFVRGWALVRGARWKLGLLTFMLWFLDTIATDLGNMLTSLMVGSSRPALHDGVSQALYVLWCLVRILLVAAVGRRLAQVEATRNPQLLADTFD